jgi:hypothetical protein
VEELAGFSATPLPPAATFASGCAQQEVDVTDAGYRRRVGDEQPQVEVVRSARRRRTVSAHRAGDRIVVSVPARLSRREESRWVALMVSRVLASERRPRPSDSELIDRATDLAARYLQGRAEPASVRWVDNMSARWGSCTPSDRTIRLSRRLVGQPAYVIDYVLLHELAHLIVPGHGPAFWQQLAGYERLERARGFLEGVDATSKK